MKETNFDVDDRSIAAQVKLTLNLAERNQEILVICGSVFLMAEAREALGIIEDRDSKQITCIAGSGLLKCKQRLIEAEKQKDKGQLKN